MHNIDILTHFTEVQRADRITVYTLKPAERAGFLAKLPLPFRTMYISDEDLLWRLANIAGAVRGDEISEKIPSKPILKSGEFTELLAYFLIPERYCPTSSLRPPKWRWKEAKNIPAHFTDIIFFEQPDQLVPAITDAVISVEAKSRATRPPAQTSSLQLAIDDVQTDFASRLAESFFHVKTKYKDDRNLVALEELKRFTEAHFPTYLKHFKAVAIVDDQFGDRHIDEITNWPLFIKDTFEVILVRINDMQNGYESTYQSMLAT
jgi:hypothetical protein